MEGDDDWDGEYSDEDIDAEAEQIASGLWAELSKCEPAAPNPKEQAAVATVRAVLASLERDSVAHATFAAAELEEASLLDVLQKIAESGTVSRAQALPLSRLLITLAKSDLLFGNLRLNKRKCEDPTEPPPPKRPHTEDLLADVSDAVRVVSNTLTANQTLTPPVVASIQTHLQRLFHFAVSSASSAAADKKTALQEIGGLIQVLGVLSGIQFAQTEQPGSVVPCPAPGCTKLFARPSSLQSHSAKHTVASAAGTEAAADTDAEEEEGEIPPTLVSRVQGVVLEVHPLLQAHVSRALGGLPEADLARVQTQSQTAAASGEEEGEDEDRDAEGEPEDVVAA